MGLDQYLYAVRKCTQNEIDACRRRLDESDISPAAYDDCELDSPGNWSVCCLPLFGSENEKLLYRDLEPFATHVTLCVREWETDKLARAKGVPLGWLECGSRLDASGHMSLTFRPPKDAASPDRRGAERITVETTTEELDRDFSRTLQVEHIMFAREQLHTWRESRELHNALSAHTCIVNCGYHRLDEAALHTLMDADPSFRAPIPRANEGVFYSAWW